MEVKTNEKNVTFIVLFALTIAVCGCLSPNAGGNSGNIASASNAGLDKRVGINELFWPGEGVASLSMPSNTDFYSETNLKNKNAMIKNSIPLHPCGDGDRFCMMVLPSVNGAFDRYSVFDPEKEPENGYVALFEEITKEYMKQKDVSLFEKYSEYIPGSAKGYQPSEEEYALMSALRNECIELALKDERWTEVSEDYEEAHNRNIAAKKEWLDKTDWTEDEKFFLDLGFELAAVYTDEGLFGDYLIENEVPFAIAGTKAQFASLLENILDETGKAQNGKIYVLQLALNPTTAGRYETLSEHFSSKMPATLAERDSLEEQRKQQAENAAVYAGW